MELPKIAQKEPYTVEVEVGKVYAWCACGLSENQPFCDGNHKGTNISPLIVKFNEAKTVYFCGCKQTANPCYCDGTHNKL